ncbi:MAG TPA: preprotein translocase subunit YajC [Candidatus Jeotgalibaca pullicola]|nr:preprotein translocase subunit YajC [Candidatus Jeotgalibaca pullicola]
MNSSFWTAVLASSVVLLVLIILIVIVYYFISKKGMSSRKTHFEDLHNSLAKGQAVIFSNGIYGLVQSVEKDTVDIQVKSGAIMTVSRYAISEIVKK